MSEIQSPITFDSILNRYRQSSEEWAREEYKDTFRSALLSSEWSTDNVDNREMQICQQSMEKGHELLRKYMYCQNVSMNTINNLYSARFIDKTDLEVLSYVNSFDRERFLTTFQQDALAKLSSLSHEILQKGKAIGIPLFLAASIAKRSGFRETLSTLNDASSENLQDFLRRQSLYNPSVTPRAITVYVPSFQYDRTIKAQFNPHSASEYRLEFDNKAEYVRNQILTSRSADLFARKMIRS